MFRFHNVGKRNALALLAAGAACVFLNPPALAQSHSPQRAVQKVAPDRLWQQADAARLLPDNQTNPLTSRLVTYRAYQADMNALLTTLKQAPMEFSVDIGKSPLVITLPMPDGTFARFTVVESPIVSHQIAADHPELKTYTGQGIDDPYATVRFDHTPDGFHAMILSPSGQVFIDPYTRGDQARYVSYYKSDVIPNAAGFQCDTPGNPNLPDAPKGDVPQPLASNGTMLRQYRLAICCTAEYAAVFGGTTSGAMNAMTTSVNRVDGVYEHEFAVRMMIVKFNIYTVVAGEPYTNNNGGAMLSQNQAVCDGANTANTGPGDSGYDFGHVFSTGGGGVAFLGVICQSGKKAGGVTGLPTPIGDSFDIDYVAHEMGHQFGANHPFNGTSGSCGGGNRNASTAYEPGSGSTIMAYAGICSPEDLQPHSDAYFHTKSFDEITTYLAGGGNGCAVQTATGNTPPTVSAGSNFTVPISTPFTLTATGSDVNGDALTYCWEEFDLGAQTPPTNTGAGVPLFRSLSPASSPSRTFPNMTALLANTATPWEALPTANKTLNFRVTARDNRAGGGGVNYAAMKLTVSGAAFVLGNRATNFTWTSGTTRTVTWTVGGGSVATKVNILLSTDGGATFAPLASNVANSGSASVSVPFVATTKARLMIQAVGNVFFDVSRVNFTIVNTAVNVSGTLTFEGIAPNATAQNVTFVFRPTLGGVNITRTVSVPKSGVFTVPNVPRNTYDVWIKGDLYLAQVVSVDTTGGDATGVTAFERAGDANNDNSCDTSDFGVLVGAYGGVQSVPGSGYLAASDFNSDGFVDTTDFGLLVGNYGAQGDL